jgi:hypothetical protein
VINLKTAQSLNFDNLIDHASELADQPLAHAAQRLQVDLLRWR